MIIKCVGPDPMSVHKLMSLCFTSVRRRQSFMPVREASLCMKSISMLCSLQLGILHLCFQAEYDKMVPAQKIRTALTEAEKLSESLRERYSAPLGKRQKLDSELPQGEGEMGQQVPESSNKPLSAEDLYKKNSVSGICI